MPSPFAPETRFPAMSILVLIPARMAATRLPGKPLADICGRPMIAHVADRAVESGVGRVVVATDSAEIRDAVVASGHEAVMTDSGHQSGSDRIFEALRTLDPDGRVETVVNVQGDLPTVEPRIVRAALEPLADAAVDIATLGVEITHDEERTDPNVVKIVGSPVEPGRLPRSRSVALGQPAPQRKVSSPSDIRTSNSGAPPRMVKAVGAAAMAASTISPPIRTISVSSSTSAPARANISLACGRRTLVPSFSRTRSAPRCSASTSSSENTVCGVNGFFRLR